MAHSLAYEGTTDNYYSLNRWSEAKDYQKIATPRKPIKGTVPRGYAGLAERKGEEGSAAANALVGYAKNGYVPYYYGNTEEARIAATNDPKVSLAYYMPTITKSEMAEATTLYNIYCGICHGEKGDGGGYLVRDGGKYPAQPSNYLTEEFVAAKDGRYYHAIMHGKNVMGAYKDKLSFKERWMVIHYIRSLQAKANGQEYPFLVEDNATETEVKAKTQSFSLEAAKELLLSAKGGDNQAPALVLENVFFETGKAVLKPISQEELNKLVLFLTSNNTVKIQVNGHTDNVGDATKNKALSEARAKAVYEYLTSKGVAADRLSYKGFGDTRPVASNDSDEGKQKNRRTDFIILK
jgi:outer membrane protein OmpA-like peptidoglycan-associated protein